jgi:hypothetical protein
MNATGVLGGQLLSLKGVCSVSLGYRKEVYKRPARPPRTLNISKQLHPHSSLFSSHINLPNERTDQSQRAFAMNYAGAQEIRFR